MLNGTIINYYYFCKRRCWLSYNKINMECNSVDVAIGKELHEERNAKNKEILIDNIKLDQITDNYIIEIKKNKTSVLAYEKQLKYYMYILHQKGIDKNGKLIYLEQDTNKEQNIEFSNEVIDEISSSIEEIENFLNSPCPPEPVNENFCKKCSYYEYCYI